jgi:Asp-tRNA(Asn)/Glu-tRNA(Gln) amidotransferase A subunit family amidase
MMVYDVQPMRAPRAAGLLLRILARLVESPITGALVGGKLLRDAGVTAVREMGTDELLQLQPDLPSARAPQVTEVGSAPDLAAVPPSLSPPEGFPYTTTHRYRERYLSGDADPREVAERLLQTVADWERLDPPMGIFIAQDPRDLRAQAEASAKRWADGVPLGPLDGVPVAVKDEMDQRGYPTTLGTSFLGKGVVGEDAEPVRRLREAGALLVGKANMHEIGIGVSGLNPHHGTARNPHDPGRWTGGSSSGSGAAVGSNLCPIALGADGGGSIRIPAALCGVVGLKPTFGRVSERGVPGLCWSVGHAGPLGATVADVAMAYAVIAGVDPRDPRTVHQPPPTLDGLSDVDLSGVRLGVFRPWFEDAEPDIVSACDGALETLRGAGAEVVEVSIPELGLLRSVHLVTIIGEMAAAQVLQLESNPRVYGVETRLNLALGRRLRADDYVHVQRHRVRLTAHFQRTLADVDVLVTPTTGCTAPVLRPDALGTGESDLTISDRVMRFAPAANLTGLPTLSVPVGHDGKGLPIGFQLMGRPWEEHKLLRLARVVEGAVVRSRPEICADLLQD